MRASGIVLAACFSAAMGCTAILGDFTLGTGTTPGSDAGDGGNVDATADAPPPIKPLVCTETTMPGRTEIARFTPGPNNGNGQYHGPFFYFATGKSEARLVFDDQSGNVETYSISTDSQTLKGAPIIEPGRLITARRGLGSIDAVMGDNMNNFYVRSLADNSSSWTAASPTNQIGAANEFNGLCVRSAALLTTDTGPIVIFTTQAENGMNCGAPGAIKAYTTGNAPLAVSWDTKFASDPTSIDLGEQSLAADKDHLYAIINGSGGAASAGTSPFFFSAPRATLVPAPPTKMALQHPNDIIDLLAVSNTVLPGKLNLGMLGGDLSGSGQTSLWVGKPDIASMPTIVAQTALAKTDVAGLSELPVNQSHQRWHAFADSENLLSFSRVFQAPGVNFYWFDDQGNNMGKQAGDTALFKDDPAIVTLDGDFANPPIPKFLGQIGVAFVEPSKGADAGPGQLSVWLSGILCKK